MKKIYLILSLALATMFVACKDESYEQPNSFSDVGFYTGGARERVLRSTAGSYMSFMDVSQGTVNHSWTIQKGNYFLRGPIGRKDTIFDQFIINKVDTISNDDTVHVLFPEGGLKEITLHNTFHDSVAFRGNNGVEDYILPSVKVGDLWVIDTTFVVDVYESLIAEIEVRQDGALVSHEKTTDTITVEVGGTLEFTDITTIGRPTERQWTVSGEVSREQVFTPTFKKLGIQTARLIVQRSGEDIPGDNDFYTMPAAIKVIPSSKPFQVTGVIQEQLDETIHVPFNGEFEPFTGKEAFFSAKVNGTDFSIKSVVINPDDATVLVVTLDDPIYRPDVVTVSLTDGSGITSTDTRVPVAFTDSAVTMNNENLLPTNVADASAWGPWWRNAPHVELSTEQVSLGTSSVKMTILPGEATSESGYSFPNDGVIPLEAGKEYIFRYKVYIDGANSPVMPLNGQMFMLNDWGWNSTVDFSTGTLPTDEWITQEVTYTRSPRDVAKLWFRINANAGQTTEATIYIDDFFLIEKEERP